MQAASCPFKLVLLASLLGASLADMRAEAAGGAIPEQPVQTRHPAPHARHGDLPDPLHVADPHLVFGFAPTPRVAPAPPPLPATATAPAPAPATAALAALFSPASVAPSAASVEPVRAVPSRTTAKPQATRPRTSTATPLAASARTSGPSIEELLGLQDQVALSALQRMLGFVAGAPATDATAAAVTSPSPGRPETDVETAVAPNGPDAVPEPSPVVDAAGNASHVTANAAGTESSPAEAAPPAPSSAPAREPELPVPTRSPVAIVLRAPTERTEFAAPKPALPTADDIDGPPPQPSLAVASAGEASTGEDASAHVATAPDDGAAPAPSERELQADDAPPAPSGLAMAEAVERPAASVPSQSLQPETAPAEPVRLGTSPTAAPVAAATADAARPAADGDASELFGLGPVALADDRLDRVRGGFVTAGGLQISFGIERVVRVNGEIVPGSTLRISTPGYGDVGGARSASGASVSGTMAVIQNGTGNTVSGGALSAAALGTIVQNTLNDQKIQTITTINATVNSLQVLRSQSLSSSLRGAVIDSLRR